MLIISDSTGLDGGYSYSTSTYSGTGSNRWPIRSAYLLAARFPNYAHAYRSWDYTALHSVTPSSGTGYAVNDTGTISGGASRVSSNLHRDCCERRRSTALTLSFQGTGYATYQAALATTATSGSGSGMTVQTTIAGYWYPAQIINTPANNTYMGDVNITSVGSGQTTTTGTTFYDTGTGSAACVRGFANPGSHCASIVVVVAGGVITSAQASNLGNLNAGDSYTSPPTFNLSSLGGTPGTVTATLYFTDYIDNMAVSGASPRLVQGANYTSAVTTQIPADLVLMNMGLNMGGSPYEPNGMIGAGPYYSGLSLLGETMTQGEPQAGMMAINQSPNWADGIHYLAMNVRSNQWGQSQEIGDMGWSTLTP